MMSNLKENVREIINSKQAELIKISHNIHNKPELAFEEEYACQLLIKFLKNHNFNVKEKLGSLSTAFSAIDGKGDLHIAICAEYDALPNVGHACGHNIIAASAIGAAIGLQPIIGELGIMLHVIGTPAEERGGGKILLLERGAFAGIHAAMMVHPATHDELYPNIIAANAFRVTYTGKEAHAAAYPYEGVNAADAMNIAQVAIGLLRQQLKYEDRVHGYTLKGGEAANIIPAQTIAEYIVRSPTLEGLRTIYQKVLKCFEAGAIATGCQLDIEERGHPYANMIHHEMIADFYKNNAEKLGRKFPQTKEKITASTDMGNVSHCIPSIHPMIGIASSPATIHQPEFTEHCISHAADKAVIDGSIAMAWTIIDIATNQNLRSKLIKSISQK